MASQALYLKWRPQRFADVVGQEHITQTLQNAIRIGHIGHAYLFTGPRGTGKTTMARLLAKAVNCLDPALDKRPCNECRICTAINEGRLLDLIEMDAASNTGVDNVREAIREKVGFRPNEARYKVYVIDEVHMLSTSAFNALLKTLEEPPEHVIFILATTEPHKILPTIVSRCQRFDFRRIPLSSMVHRLGYIAEEEGVQIEEGALRFIARMATGCARDAIGLLDQLTAYGDELITVERVGQVLGLGDAQMVNDLIAHLGAHNIGRGLNAIHRAVEQGVDTRQFAQQVVDALRVLLLLRAGDESGLQEVDAQTQADLRALAQQFTTYGLVQAIKLFNQAQLDLRGSDQNQIALELAFVEAALLDAPPAVAAATGSAAAGPPVHAVPVAVQTPPKTTPTAQTATLAPPTSTRPAAPTRVPTRSSYEQHTSGGALSEQESKIAPSNIVITLEEILANWTEIQRNCKEAGAKGSIASGFLNTALNPPGNITIENNNIVTLWLFESNVSRVKPEHQKIIKESISSTLGKECEIRVASINDVQTASNSQSTQEAAGPVSQTQPVPDTSTTDIRQQAMRDPVVQELIKRGGRIKSVEEIQDKT